MSIKEYSLSVELKRQLGYIIKECRLNKYNQYKKNDLESINPFTKENFCNGSLSLSYIDQIRS